MPSEEVKEQVARRTREIVTDYDFWKSDLYMAMDQLKKAGATVSLDIDLNASFIAVSAAIQALNELKELHGTTNGTSS